ncbi:MAG: PAS domain-containing protein, partial [Pseudomonadota bacterium]
MDTPSSSSGHTTSFKNAAEFLSALNAETTGHLVKYAADVALIIEDGIIADVAVSNVSLEKEAAPDGWLGKPWASTVTVESKSKIEELLSAPTSEFDGPSRQVTHLSNTTNDIPVGYKTVRTGGRIVALGQDLRNFSRIQQKLVRAHQDLERDYGRLREMEARYRILFDSIDQPILVVDADSLKIESGNPAAAEELGLSPESMLGQDLTSMFETAATRQLDRFTARALSSGMATAQRLQTRTGASCSLKASAFNRAGDTLLIIQFSSDHGPRTSVTSERDSALFDAVESLPDALIVTDGDLRVLAANRAFMEMAQLPESALSGNANLGDFLGRSSTDINVLMSSLKSESPVRNFATILTDRFGIEENVEVSAVSATNQGKPVFGFSIRNVERRLEFDSNLGERLPSTADQLTNLVGRVP